MCVLAPGCGPKTNRNVKQAIKWQHADFAHKLTNRISLGASLSALVFAFVSVVSVAVCLCPLRLFLSI